MQLTSRLGTHIPCGLHPFARKGDAVLEEKPSLVRATTMRRGLSRVPAVQIGGLLMTSEIWCPAPLPEAVAKVSAAPTVRQGLEIARALGYGCKSAA